MPTVSLPHSLIVPLSHCPTASRSHCITVLLYHCFTDPLPHCLIVPLSYCLTVALPHGLTVSLPHSPSPTVLLYHCLTDLLSHCSAVSLSHCLTVRIYIREFCARFARLNSLCCGSSRSVLRCVGISAPLITPLHLVHRCIRCVRGHTNVSPSRGQMTLIGSLVM